MRNDSLRDHFGTNSPPERLRVEWRREAKHSTFFLAKSVIGYPDLTVGCHSRMAHWIEKPTRRKLGLAPRDHLKTSVWTIADSLRRVVAEPNIRILIENETIANASNFLTKIKAVVERGAIFRWLFPELIPNFTKVRWTRDAIEFPRTVDFPEATIEVMGVGGASTSRHYNLIKEDDLVGREASESPTVMAKAIDQHKLAESLLNDPNDEIQTYGTRWHPYDLATWMIEHETDLDYFHLAIAHPPGSPAAGQPIWPERFSVDEILRLRRKLGPAMFALQYQNEALAEGVTEFHLDDLRFWHWGRADDGTDALVLERPLSEGGPIAYRAAELDFFETIDPCLSAESGEARSAVCVAGLTPDSPYNVVLVEATARKCSPKQTVQLAWDAYQRWQPLSAAIEVVAGQVAFFYWMVEAFPHMGIRKLKTDPHKSKLSRIRSLGPLAEQGRLYLHRDHIDFMEEWQAFPNGRTVDLLDAAAYLPQIWSAPVAGEDEPPGGDPFDVADDPALAHDGRSPVTGY